MDSPNNNIFRAPVTFVNFSHHFFIGSNKCALGFIFPLAAFKGEIAAVARYGHIFVYKQIGTLQKIVMLQHNNTFKNFLLAQNKNFIALTKNNILVISESGEIIKTVQSIHSSSVSITKNGIIYLANFMNGVYQSIDNGFTWEHVFKTVEYCNHVIKIENRSVFWIKEHSVNSTYTVRLYKADQDSLNRRKITRITVILPETVQQNEYQRNAMDLAYDGDISVFLYEHLDGFIYLYDANGQYLKQLAKLEAGMCIVADTQLKLIYSQKGKCAVNVYKLVY